MREAEGALLFPCPRAWYNTSTGHVTWYKKTSPAYVRTALSVASAQQPTPGQYYTRPPRPAYAGPVP
eukprot:3940303-Rhodomonas_salina.4